MTGLNFNKIKLKLRCLNLNQKVDCSFLERRLKPWLRMPVFLQNRRSEPWLHARTGVLDIVFECSTLQRRIKNNTNIKNPAIPDPLRRRGLGKEELAKSDGLSVTTMISVFLTHVETWGMCKKKVWEDGGWKVTVGPRQKMLL